MLAVELVDVLEVLEGKKHSKVLEHDGGVEDILAKLLLKREKLV
jgi:hypothetical protein